MLELESEDPEECDRVQTRSTVENCCLSCLSRLRLRPRNPPAEQRIFGIFSQVSAVRQPHDMKTGQRWILILFAIVSSVVVIVLLSSVRVNQGGLTITLDLDELTERGKCPACFGVNLCPQMVSGKIELNDWTKYSVSKLVNSKNIFYATWKARGGDREVILKKLAHDNELAQLDREICERHGKEHTCDVKDSVRYLIEKYAHTTSNKPDEPILHGEKIGKITDVLLCPTHDKMDYLVTAVTKINKGPHRSTIMAHILTMLLLNPEPLILQTFRSEDGWPFPVYYGACGRIVAEEYVGRRLATFYKDDFRTRALIARDLLKIAFTLSNKNANFVLYLTDISPDNFAVNEKDYSVKVIDLENVLVVDKNSASNGKAKAKDQFHVSESISCVNKQSGNSEGMCFAFSSDDLCGATVSDHNYYAICAGLLANDALSQEFPNGLLHSIPPEMLASKKYSKIAEYLESCRLPGPKLNRIEAANNLLRVLSDYLGISV